jgi:RNA polymerase sigma-70 factor (ECF subfamily)
MAEGPDAGLALLEGLDDPLERFHLLPAARADLLRRLGRIAESRAAYDAALALDPPSAERLWLTMRRDGMDERLA